MTWILLIGLSIGSVETVTDPIFFPSEKECSEAASLIMKLSARKDGVFKYVKYTSCKRLSHS
jgi:hypothetical protein